MPALPTGTVTYLFTDVEDSTRLWERHPDAMGPALARHDEIIEEAVGEHGGQVVRPRGEGDSRFAVFARASDAVAAAAEVQRALHAEPWPTPTPLRVRAALHTGEADLRDGDYYGTAVNRCARLRAAAHGAQTLVSAATHELVRDQLPGGAALRDLGEHRLKDLQRPEHVFQLVVDGLPADFPPLATLDTRPQNLPVERSPLIGRERESAALAQLLMREDAGLVTLTGPGGTGKTRLALQVAAELIDRFDDGVFLVDLAPITDHTLVVSEIAHTLGVREGGGQPLLETLKDSLLRKQLLLVLDNFEQVAHAAPVVSQLLAAAPAVKILVTSRVPLHIRGEREYGLPPLQVPDPKHPPPAERLGQYEAVRLFIERAVEVRGDFRVTNENAPAVAEICARLDGLPLAIELAAARIKVLTPQALLARLGSRLTLLTGGARDAASRQQTLRNTIDWSYDLLADEERRLFRRLAVFVGGGTLEAIDAVCHGGGDGALDVLEGVSALVDQSLVRPGEGDGGAGGASGEPRFAMLETIREYAREKLAESGEAEELQGRHARYFLALAERAAPLLTTAEQAEWLTRLDAEADNMRAALTWCQAGDGVAGLRLAGSLYHYWTNRARLAESVEWLAVFLARAPAPTLARAWALTGLGTLLWVGRRDLAVAEATLREGVDLSRALGERGPLLEAFNALGWVRQVRAGPGARAGILAEWVALSRELGDRRAEGRALGHQGYDARLAGDLARSAALLDESMALLRAAGDQYALCLRCHWRGETAWAAGDDGRALALADEIERLAREGGFAHAAQHSWQLRGAVAWARGDAAAVAHAERALAIWEAYPGYRRDTAPRTSLARAALATGDLGRSRALLAAAWAERVEEPSQVAHWLGRVAQREGDGQAALGWLRAAVRLYHARGEWLHAPASLEVLAAVLASDGRLAPAARLLAATGTTRAAWGLPRPPVEQPGIDAMLATVRASLGEDPFAAAWAAGEALTIQAAVEEILALLDQLGAEEGGA